MIIVGNIKNRNKDLFQYSIKTLTGRSQYQILHRHCQF